VSSLLRDLIDHQAWADAESWNAIEAHPPAREHGAIRHRLHHLHLVQQFFTWAVGERAAEFSLSTPEDFSTFEDLKMFARRSHSGVSQFMVGVTDVRLAERISIPWFRDPPLALTVSEALMQCAMHSQWHRGQNATRLRELGATPPTSDLIIWYWKGRPSAAW
jgi:uncharacterized damage-inducible protein DinB